MSQSHSQYIKAKVNASHHLKKMMELRDVARKKQKLLAVKEQELAEGRQEVSELKRTWRNYEKQIQEEGAVRGRGVELDQNQVNQLQNILIKIKCSHQRLWIYFFGLQCEIAWTSRSHMSNSRPKG